MALATVAIVESNGGTNGTPAARTAITNTNMGSTEEPNIVIGTGTAITAGNNSYEKWQQFYVSSMGDSESIKNLKVWPSAALATYATHNANLKESAYVATLHANYVVPVATASSYAIVAISAYTEPTGANLGIAGSLTGSITVPGYSDYLVMQIVTTASAVAGTTITMNYQYDEYQ